jgi:hypothetical protein
LREGHFAFSISAAFLAMRNQIPSWFSYAYRICQKSDKAIEIVPDRVMFDEVGAKLEAEKVLT